MAKDYKEGVDFEWVKGNAKNTKVRKFFSAEEKAAAASPKKEAPAKVSKPSKVTKPKVAKAKPIPKASPVSGASRSTAGKVKEKPPSVNSTAPTMGNNDIKPVRLKPKTKAVVKEKPSPVSGASRSTDGKVKDKKPVAGVSGASRSVAGKVSDQAKRNAKRAKEPVAAWLYDKAYGKDKWKPKK